MAVSRVDNFVESMRKRQAAGGQGTSTPAGSNGGSPKQGARKAELQTPPIFDPQILSSLGRLELISSTVVDGFLSGKHRSTHKGGCTDFAECRPYAPGDDLRLLDWRQYAKSDRYYVKQFDDETNLQALLIVDASGSMRFGMSTVSKWRYAQMAAACIGHMMLRQRDSVGLAVAGKHLQDYVRPLPRANHLARVIDVLQNCQPAGDSALDEVLLGLTDRLKRRGMVILFSDCFCDVPALQQALQQFRARGHDVLVFQVLAPEELSFPFRREAFFQDLELSHRLQINPNALRKQYLEEFQGFMDQLKKAAVDVPCDLVTLTTDCDLGESLAHYLIRRAAQKKTQTTRARA